MTEGEEPEVGCPPRSISAAGGRLFTTLVTCCYLAIVFVTGCSEQGSRLAAALMETAGGLPPLEDPFVDPDPSLTNDETLTAGRDASLTLGTDSLIVLGTSALFVNPN